VPELENPPLPFKTTLRVAEALRLPATQLHEIMPARIARKGSTRLLVPIADPRDLDTLAPNFDTLMALGNELGADGFFVFALNRNSDECRPNRACSARRSASPKIRSAATRTPCSRPIFGISANSARIQQSFIGHQGRQMKRPGQVSVKLEIDQGQPGRRAHRRHRGHRQRRHPGPYRWAGAGTATRFKHPILTAAAGRLGSKIQLQGCRHRFDLCFTSFACSRPRPDYRRQTPPAPWTRAR
jgi:hypothetical protein